MPTCKLQGGLGNQMFEYALGYRLSRDFHEPLVCDGYFLESCFFLAKWTLRSYELDVFGIEKKYTVPSLFVRKYIHPVCIEQIRKLRFGKRYIQEKSGAHVDSFPEHAYLDGWFQSYKYFDAYEDAIRETFTVKTPISEINQRFLDYIKNAGNESVSIHVRRGDYLLAQNQTWHGVCSIEYYEQAIARLLSSGKKTFFVFSDDIEWCKEHIHFPEGIEAYYVDHNGHAGHEDLRLMYSCAHHIIANSSFSWWGAYLGRNPDRVVIAPEKWLETNTYNTHDLIPPSWILL